MAYEKASRKYSMNEVFNFPVNDPKDIYTGVAAMEEIYGFLIESRATIPSFDISGMYELFEEDYKNRGWEDRYINPKGYFADITVKTLGYENYDSERSWTLEALYYQGKPVYLMQRAGRGGCDHRAIYAHSCENEMAFLRYFMQEMIGAITDSINNGKMGERNGHIMSYDDPDEPNTKYHCFYSAELIPEEGKTKYA